MAIWQLVKRVLGRETRRERFTRYAQQNKWRNDESLSGPGSTLAYTENLRSELPKLFRELEISTMLDAPCGDFNWFQKIQLPADFRYIGGEIVPDLVAANSEKYANDQRSFVEVDITKDDLPSVDLWMCRDALFHFCYRDFFATLENLFRSEIKYILTTSHTECTQNTEIRTGSFRVINLELGPFSFPAPDVWIDDWIEGFPVRKMGLWKVSSLQSALESNEMFQAYLAGKLVAQM